MVADQSAVNTPRYQLHDGVDGRLDRDVGRLAELATVKAVHSVIERGRRRWP